MVDSDSSDEMLDYPSFEGNACIPLFFCFLFENQLFNLIQVNVIFSPTITDNKLKLQQKLTQKSNQQISLGPYVGIRNSGLKWKSEQYIKQLIKLGVHFLKPFDFFILKLLIQWCIQDACNV